MNGNGPSTAPDGALPVEVVRTLRVAPSAGGIDHLSAASGLVVIGDLAYVVADDEHALGLFDLASDGPGRLLRLFDEALPDAHNERKARKADLEALTVLPALDGHPHGALLAIGSGSKPNRCRGALLALNPDGAVAGDVQSFDLTGLYAPLRVQFAELNIEGLFVNGGALCLLQRGSQVSPANACIRFDLAEFGRWLTRGGPPPQPTTITTYPLGSIAGVPLTFTDGAALPATSAGGWVFCAAAEDTCNSYLDGVCAGSAVGMVDSSGTLHGPFAIASPAKVEGIALDPRVPGTVLLVTDADDRQAPASLLRANLATLMPLAC
jgi:hypothetical protein